MLPDRPMRHYPAYCSDCKRLWLVATIDVPSASPTCPRCQERGRLVPGAYYSEPASVFFMKLENAICDGHFPPSALGRLATDLEHLLPSPTEPEIDHAFNEVIGRLGLATELSVLPGKRVALRMVVTIASTLSQPAMRESGVMRLPQTIHGLFDVQGKVQPAADGGGSKGEA
jgi:hypothetical protein